MLNNDTQIFSEYHLERFPYFSRFSIRSTISDLSKTIKDDVPYEQMIEIEVPNVLNVKGFLYLKKINIRGIQYVRKIILITDSSYDVGICYSLIRKLVYSDEGEATHIIKNTMDIANPSGNKSSDDIRSINKNLNETTVIIKRSIESLLERGDKLEELSAKSEQLMKDSAGFKKDTSYLNRCCILI